MNYYEHHLGDYAAATAHLTWDEDAAYTRLIRAYYHHEKPIPLEVKDACRLVRAQSAAQRKAVETVLQEFFIRCDDGWHQKRCDEEIERFKDKQSKAKRSADARWSAKRSDSEGNANASGTHNERIPDAMPAQSEGNAPSLQSPVSSPKLQAPDSGVELDISSHSESSHRLLSQSARAKPKRRERKNFGLNGHADAFAQIQAAYPKRAGGQRWQDAAHAYSARLQEGRTHAEILAGVERYAKFVRDKGDEGTPYVQQAGTFLGTNRGFLDPWTPAPSKAEQRLGTNLSAAAEFMRRTEKPQ